VNDLHRRMARRGLAILSAAALLFTVACATPTPIEIRRVAPQETPEVTPEAPPPAPEDLCAQLPQAEPAADLLAVPLVPGEAWDPIAFNRIRGNAGAIPPTYLDDVNGPDGTAVHLGKHLPYLVPRPEGVDLEDPAQWLAIMWGDPSLGYTPHPNAPRSATNHYEGHWYNWIQIRKAIDGPADEVTTRFSDWPTQGANDDPTLGIYASAAPHIITDDAGVHTIYLVRLPADVVSGDTVRIWAHCLTHGEYVDFLQVP